MNIQGLDLCLMPLILKLSRGEVAQRRVDTLVYVNLVKQAAYLAQDIRIVHIFRQLYLFLLNRAHKPLRIAILPGFAHLGHTDLDASVLEPLSVGGGSVLHALVRVMDLRGILGQRPLQGEQCQGLIQRLP